MNQNFDQETLKQILEALDVKLDAKHRAALQEHMETTLRRRVGLALVDLLDDDEVAELVTLTSKGDQAMITAWLNQHVPDYQDVVQDEIDILLGDLAENSDQL
jgi:hypothetical protein